MIVILLIAGLGKLFLSKSDRQETRPTESVGQLLANRADWSKHGNEAREIMDKACRQAEQQAAAELDAWIEENMKRVETDFFDWYFSYWTQQELGIHAFFAGIRHALRRKSPTALEKITALVQEEFSNRVIRPVIAQQQIEKIIQKTAQGYIAAVREQIPGAAAKYEIKQVQWNRYTGDMSALAAGIKANRQVSLPVKAAVGAAVGATYMTARAFSSVITKIGSKISKKFAARLAAEMAARGSGKAAVRTRGLFVGMATAVGVIAWDILDHYITKRKAAVLLRRNISDYLKESKELLLHDPDYGIMRAIYRLEHMIYRDYKPS